MAKPSVKLWKALQELKDDEFKKFKWFLKQDDISAAQLEKADRQDTVDLMAQKYGGTGAMNETMMILEKISRNDLVQGLQNSSQDPKDLSVLKEEHERWKAELKSTHRFAVEVTLDPDTACPSTIRSGDQEQVHCGDARKLLKNPERFYRCVCLSGPRINQQEGTNPTNP
ncbi:zinc finger protein RFP-like [Sander vitreus]